MSIFQDLTPRSDNTIVIIIIAVLLPFFANHMVKKTLLVAIDLGSNSIRLICGSPHSHPQNSLKICLRKLRIARLGEGFEPDGYLKPTSMERAIQVLKELTSQFRGYCFDHIRMVTTGVVREAKNQAEFLLKRYISI